MKFWDLRWLLKRSMIKFSYRLLNNLQICKIHLIQKTINGTNFIKTIPISIGSQKSKFKILTDQSDPQLANCSLFTLSLLVDSAFVDRKVRRFTLAA